MRGLFPATFLAIVLFSGLASGQQKPTTGYAPVNGLKMYFEIHGKGEPVVLLHGAFMAISGDWQEWVNELAKTRKVIAVELQGHGRTADIDRDMSAENLSDDISALLGHLKIAKADVVGYSLGGGVAIMSAIRHPENVRKVVSISAPFRLDGWVKEGREALPNLTAEVFKGSPMEAEYKRLSPTPDKFPEFIKHVVAMAGKPYDFGADKFAATKAPMFFVHGDADGVRMEHIAEMFRLKGGGNIHGDMQPRSASRLAIVPDTTHVTLMNHRQTLVPMINAFLDAKP
ncbi:MAG TPA: alpha/beta hydrolase [Pyrinomonadaceae bacterium]|nr:alpha/beta hydrolase [Pyrinomonadaceae bacterium]